MRPTATTLLKKAKLPSFLVSDPVNIRYLTGCTVSEGLLLAHKGRFTFFVDSRYTEEVEATARKEIHIASLSSIHEVLKGYTSCGIESSHITLARFGRWKKGFKNTKIIQTSNLIEDFRRSKDSHELADLRHARKLTRQVIDRIPESLRIGMTERELSWQLEVWAHEVGADGFSFPSIVAFGPNSSQPHHHITERKLKKGDVIQIDMGLRVNGYCGDLSEVFFAGDPTPEQAKCYNALVKAKKEATKAVHSGVSSRKLDTIARKVLEEQGIEKAFTHALGHGVGLDVHEGVVLSKNGPDETLLKNEVVTIEPGVYFPGKFGMRLEDMVFVKD